MPWPVLWFEGVLRLRPRGGDARGSGGGVLWKSVLGTVLSAAPRSAAPRMAAMRSAALCLTAAFAAVVRSATAHVDAGACSVDTLDSGALSHGAAELHRATARSVAPLPLTARSAAPHSATAPPPLR